MLLSRLLWLDCTAGFAAGVIVLLARGWLSKLYALPESLLLTIGIANLTYACFSFSLAVAPRLRTRWSIGALAVANMCWGVGCFVMGSAFIKAASVFGLMQLFGEGVFVGVLGLQEWRARRTLGTYPLTFDPHC